MENVVYLPFPGKRELNGEGGNNFFHLEVTMIFLVQFLQWPARFDVVPVEHHQVPGLVFQGLGSLGVHIATHPFLHYF